MRELPAPPTQHWLTLALTLTLGAGTAWLVQQQRVKLARQDAAEARRALREVAASLHDSEAARHALEAEAARLEAERRSGADGGAPEPAAQEPLPALTRELAARLAPDIKKGDALLVPAGGALSVELSAALLFEADASALSGRGAEALLRVVGALGRAPVRSLEVSGHTDPPTAGGRALAGVGGWELSAARAAAVARFLSEHGHWASGQLSALAYAGARPVQSEASAQGRLRNRRIELKVVTAAETRRAARPAAPRPTTR